MIKGASMPITGQYKNSMYIRYCHSFVRLDPVTVPNKIPPQSCTEIQASVMYCVLCWPLPRQRSGVNPVWAEISGPQNPQVQVRTSNTWSVMEEKLEPWPDGTDYIWLGIASFPLAGQMSNNTRANVEQQLQNGQFCQPNIQFSGHIRSSRLLLTLFYHYKPRLQ